MGGIQKEKSRQKGESGIMKIFLTILITVFLVLAALLIAALMHTLCIPKKFSDYKPHPDEKRAKK